MLRRITLLVLMACVTAVGLSVAPSPGLAAAQERPLGRIIVQYESARVQAQTLDGLAPSLADQGFRVLPVPVGRTQAQFLAELKRNPDVVSATVDASAYAAAVPADPYYAANQAAYMAAIGAPAGWELASGSNTVIVAVLDSGIDVTHEDLSGRLWENQKDLTADGIDDDGNGCTDDRYGCRIIDGLSQARQDGCGYRSTRLTGAVQDDHGRPNSFRHSHGTLVSGIIGAAGNNGKGISGVAWNVRLMTVKVLDCGPFGGSPRADISSIAEGIDYARRMGANIINISISSDPGDQTADAPVLRKALADAEKAGVIVVAAAGNHSPNASQAGPGYPGAYTQYSNLVTVGAADGSGQWATFSNYGPALDFAAPGIGVAGTVRSDIGFATPYGSDADGGTSFSSPLVAGLFALLISRNSSLEAAEYIRIAQETATPAAAAPHGQNWAGAGIINIGRALERVPMTIDGTALRDFKDVPNGTEVRATVSNLDCGSSLVTSFGPVARYALRVRSDAEQAGCGAPGRTVQFLIAGAPAVPTIAWGGRDADLGLQNRDISSVSPPPGQVVVQTLNGTWSNIAQLEAGGLMPNALANLSSPWNTLLRWNAAKPFLESAGGYDRYIKTVPGYVNDLTDVARYDALWIDAGAANVATLNPNALPGRAIILQPGWNNFVYTGSGRAVADALAELDGKYTQVLQYDNATAAWLSHIPGRPRYLNDFGGLFKYKVYWVFLTAPATLRMD